MNDEKSVLLMVAMAALLTLTLMSSSVVAAQDRGSWNSDDSNDDDDEEYDPRFSARERAAIESGYTDAESLSNAHDTLGNLEHKGGPVKDTAKSCTISGVAGMVAGGPAGSAVACGLSSLETVANPRNYEEG